MPVMHHVPGRLRIRMRGVKGNPVQAHTIERVLEDLHGVTDAESNTRTGSVVVHYDPKTTNVSSVLAAIYVDSVYPALCLPPEWNRNSAQEKLAQKAAEAVLGILIEKAVERSVLLLLAALF